MKLQNRMMRLELNFKSGFRNVTGKPIVILDHNYNIFYDTRNLQTKVWEFNLPAGIYYLQEGKLRQTMHPVEYKLDPLPRKEKHLRYDPEKFPIIFTDNKYVGSVYWDPERSPYGKCVIVFDKSLQNKSIPELQFIYYHECAHRFWNTEDACDTYASNRMLMEGFNPSQIGLAMINTLSDNNYHRKAKMVEAMIAK